MLVAFRCLLGNFFFFLFWHSWVWYATCSRKETHGIRHSTHCQAPPVTAGNMEVVMVP